MNQLLEEIRQKDSSAFTHSGKFHADDVFSAALLLYLNPEITIIRGNKVPDDYKGLVFDIGRGQYDHHQKDSRVRENGVPYAHLVFSGKHLEQRSWEQDWQRNLTNRLSSRWIITITQGRKTSSPH